MNVPTARRLAALTALTAAVALAAPAAAGTRTSGLFVEFRATRSQEPLPASLATKQMCVDRAGTHTFAPSLRIENRQSVVITGTLTGFEFAMTLTRRGSQPTLAKTANFRVTPNGTRPIEGGAARINFSMELGDCVDLTFAPRDDLSLLSGEVLTASLFLTREPSAPPPPDPDAPCISIGGSWRAQWSMPQCGASAMGTAVVTVDQTGCAIDFDIPGLGSFSGTLVGNESDPNLTLQFEPTAPGSGAACPNPSEAGLEQEPDGRLFIPFGSGPPPCCQHGTVGMTPADV